MWAGGGLWGEDSVFGDGSHPWDAPQVPVELVLLLTVPVVDPDKDDLNWKRPLNCLHIVTSPLLCVLTLKSGACKIPQRPRAPPVSSKEGTRPSWPQSPRPGSSMLLVPHGVSPSRVG